MDIFVLGDNSKEPEEPKPFTEFKFKVVSVVETDFVKDAPIRNGLEPLFILMVWY